MGTVKLEFDRSNRGLGADESYVNSDYSFSITTRRADGSLEDFQSISMDELLNPQDNSGRVIDFFREMENEGLTGEIPKLDGYIRHFQEREGAKPMEDVFRDIKDVVSDFVSLETWQALDKAEQAAPGTQSLEVDRNNTGEVTGFTSFHYTPDGHPDKAYSISVDNLRNPSENPERLQEFFQGLEDGGITHRIGEIVEAADLSKPQIESIQRFISSSAPRAEQALEELAADPDRRSALEDGATYAYAGDSGLLGDAHLAGVETGGLENKTASNAVPSPTITPGMNLA